MGFEENELTTHRLRLITDNMLDMVSIINPEGIIECISSSIINILGYESERLVGYFFSDIVHPQDLNQAVTAFRTAVETAAQTREETRCRHAHGHYLWLDSVVTPVTGDNGMVKTIVLASRDITGRKHAEQYLRNERQKLYSSEERFSKAFRASPCAMSIHRLADGKIIDVNNSFLTGLGYGREEVIGATSSKLKLWVEPGNFPKIIAIINRKQGVVSNYEIKFFTKSGEERLGLLSAEIIELNNESCILMAVNDITELRHCEREMARLDRLNLIGQMAAGIGHEIRNPMTAVRGLLQLLSDKEGQRKYKDYYDLMIGELDRANLIITEYLSLAKNKAINLQPSNLNTIIEAMYPLLSADAKIHDKSIIVELGNVPDILIDEKEIRQLILNLARNGLEAMPTGGNLTINTFPAGGEVVLSVQDQGDGIMPEVMDRIGTPFFTTKDTGTGREKDKLYPCEVHIGLEVGV